MDWQDISTAPRNGSPVLLSLAKPIHSNELESYLPWKEIQVVIGWWNHGGWEISFMEDGSADTEGYSSHFYIGAIYGLPSAPTHWMPLPPPPHKQGEG